MPLILEQTRVIDAEKLLIIEDKTVYGPEFPREDKALVLLSYRRGVYSDTPVSGVTSHQLYDGQFPQAPAVIANAFAVPVYSPGLYRHVGMLLPLVSAIFTGLGTAAIGRYAYDPESQKVVQITLYTAPTETEEGFYGFTAVANPEVAAMKEGVETTVLHGTWDYDYRCVLAALIAHYHTDRCRNKRQTRELYEDLTLAVNGLRANTAFGYYQAVLECIEKADALLLTANKQLV